MRAAWQVIYRICFLAHKADLLSAQKRREYETVEAERYADLSKRLQLAVGTCLDYFGSDVVGGRADSARPQLPDRGLQDEC